MMKGCSERSRVWRGRVTVSVSLRAHLATDGGVCARRRVISYLYHGYILYDRLIAPCGPHPTSRLLSRIANPNGRTSNSKSRPRLRVGRSKIGKTATAMLEASNDAYALHDALHDAPCRAIPRRRLNAGNAARHSSSNLPCPTWLRPRRPPPRARSPRPPSPGPS